jgi:parallel beta-helix repeat protein
VTFLLRVKVVAAGLAAATALGVLTSAAPMATASVTSAGGQPAIADTAFPVPAGALVVAPNGKDTNPGTTASPLATLTKAVQKASGGGTIVLRAGTYREGIRSISKRVTIQPYPHEQVWIKGSQVVTGFVRGGTTWTKAGWTTNLCATCYPAGVEASNPAAGLPDQVFIDGVPQVQVTSQAAVTAGMFYVDRSASRLVLGSDPSGHVVEATVLDKAMQFDTQSAAGSIVRGLGFAHFGSHYNTDVAAMVIANSSGMTIDSNTFAFSASRGLAVYGTGATVTNNRFASNGYAAFLAHRADGLVFQHNDVRNSNTEHFVAGNPATSSWGTLKITNSADIVIRDNVLRNNDLHGIWLDISCYRFTVVNNLVEGSGGIGIWAEISGFGIIASNVSSDNAGDGIRVGGANDVKVWNNTLANNGSSQLYVYEDARKASSSVDASRGITYDTQNLSIRNNLLVADTSTTSALLQTWDGNSPKKVDGTTMVPDLDSNAYVRNGTTAPKSVVVWAKLASPYQSGYPTLSSFGKASGQDGTGWETVNGGSSLFVNEGNGNYRLTSQAAVRGTGAPLPSDVAAAIGVAAGGQPDRGALVFMG